MEKLSGSLSDAFVRLRAQPAILYYRVRSSPTDCGKPGLKFWGRKDFNLAAKHFHSNPCLHPRVQGNLHETVYAAKAAISTL
jgi:hypothetical protein